MFFKRGLRITRITNKLVTAVILKPLINLKKTKNMKLFSNVMSIIALVVLLGSILYFGEISLSLPTVTQLRWLIGICFFCPILCWITAGKDLQSEDAGMQILAVFPFIASILAYFNVL
jgi:CDP-diglyceride synthetase